MNSAVFTLLEKITFADAQVFQNLTILPILYEDDLFTKYIVLDKALKEDYVEIQEVSEGGSVPELFVVNKSNKRILLVDGEELIGAKQNRIINTSILLKKMSKTKIPVSCVEEGRWRYSSKSFSSSGYSSPSSVRRSKSQSVSDSLRSSGTYYSNQGDVWNEVRRISHTAKVSSPSGSMSDVFDSRKGELDAIVSKFPVLDGQKGYVVFINGELVGFDYLSKEEAFKQIFKKLLRGYSLEALLNKKNYEGNGYSDKAIKFFDNLKGCEEKKYKSVGLGYDYRYENEQLIASALIVKKETEKVIHFAGHNIIGYEV